MTDQFVPNVIGTSEVEVGMGEFHDSGFICEVTAVRRWDVGENDTEREVNGKKYLAGRTYLSGDKPSAEAFAKDVLGNIVEKTGQGLAIPVLLMTAPMASVTNKTDEVKAKFGAVLQAGVQLQGLAKDGRGGKNGAGYNLLTMPSVVDAYARAVGIYKDPLFNPDAIGDIRLVEDAKDTIDQLIEVRKAIWKAMGCEKWTIGNAEDATGELKTALARMLSKDDLKYWARFHQVPDPSPGAYYKSNKTGLYTRRRAPVITEFFPNERTAVEAGKLELVSTSQANGKLDVIAIWPKLSDEARSTYGDPSGLESSIAEIVAELGKNTPKIKVAKSYGLKVADLELLVQ